jgi:F0F1-type ATP synthase assembly protein I
VSSDERPAGPVDPAPVDAPVDTPVDAASSSTPDDARGEGPADRTVPDEATLAAIATPATGRRAPKVSAFITVGVLLGLVIGWVVGALGTGTTGEGRTGAILLTMLGFVVLGAIVASGLAVVADRRSLRGRSAGAGR